MKIVILYDSWYGNTTKIALAIARGLTGDTQLIKVSDLEPEAIDVTDADLLIVGSPTHGGVATPAMLEALHYLGWKQAGMPVATFDTRMKQRWVRLFGFAARSMARELTHHGADLIVAPEGFLVEKQHGPLAKGEEARAEEWGNHLAAIRSAANITEKSQKSAV